jgi:hypothetical protein
MAAVKLEVHLSQLVDFKSNAVSATIPMFSGSAISTVVVEISSRVTGSQKSNMATVGHQYPCSMLYLIKECSYM